jgi:ribosomal protein S12 methylthiotransferase accessory factor
MCPFNPNGHAAGNTLEEAILQAFLELVERDAVGIWWYNRINRPGIDLESFDDRYFINVRQHYAELNWQIWVLDLTTDLQIPSAIAIARHRTKKDFYIGMGSHLDFHLAVQRAITELHQISDPDGHQDALWNERDIEIPDFLFPIPNRKAIQKAHYTTPNFRTIKDDIEFCVDKVKSIGLDFMVINHTRPDIGLATVKVIVPGLRHFWRRLGPGRLYDVPVDMGWLKTPNREEQLNPLTLKV